MKWRIPERGRYISQEPHIIAPLLLGAPLASFRRRLAAFALDLLVFGILIVLLFLGLTLLSFQREDPRFIPLLRTTLGADDEAVRKDAARRLGLSFATIAMARRQDAFRPEVADAIRAQDPDQLGALLGDKSTTISLTTDETKLVETDTTLNLRIGNDMLLGGLERGFSWAGYFIAWFTIWTWIGRGRTLGKRVFGIRVIRLDGCKLSLWNCFGRASGYGASAATLLLGFLEAIWHPNRQALHDKISSTVVVRGRD